MLANTRYCLGRTTIPSFAAEARCAYFEEKVTVKRGGARHSLENFIYSTSPFAFCNPLVQEG